MAKYYGITTAIGEAAIANSFLAGQKVNITHLAIGDGNGSYYEPTSSMTALRREVYRVAANVTIDPNSPNVVMVDGMLPAEVGGFTVRELAVYDDKGRCIGVANTPDSPKVVMADGADTEMILGLAFAVSHAAAINLQVDPTIIIATKKDVATHNTSPSAHSDIRAVISTIQTTLEQKADTVDATATYATGTYTITGAPSELPARFTLRFTAPAKYTSGDVLQIGSTQLAVTTMTAPAEAAPDDAWATGALVVLNVDTASGKAFLAGGGGGGSAAIVQTEPPETGKPGQLWFSPDTKIMCIWYGDQWIPLAGTAV